MEVIAEIIGERIELSADLHMKELIKTVPGSRWDPEARIWHVPLSWASCKVLRGVFGDRLQVGEKLAAWAWEERRARVDPCLALRDKTDAEGDSRLYPFQRAGVEFLALAQRALLADEMGTGKTIQTIMTLKRLVEQGHDPFPALVICPNSMKRTWAREFRTWYPEVESFIVTGGAGKRRKAIADAAASEEPAVAIINWESVRLHTRLKQYGRTRLTDAEREPKELNEVEWHTVVADEAHKLKDPNAKQTRAVWAVGHQAGVRYRYALTGTPIANHPGDLWSLLHFIDPNEWPRKTGYNDRYCLLSWNRFGGMEVVGIRPEMKDEFFGIVDPRMRRMPKELVLPHLPPKTRQVREVEMTPKQAKAYKQMHESMIAALEDGTLLATNPLSQLTRLVQFSSTYAEVQGDGSLLMAEPSCKLDAMMELLEELGDEPCVVASESRQLIELACARLEKAGISFRTITGATSEAERDRGIEDFQAGRARVMLFTMKAGGVGVTLTRAGHLIFLQRSWSMLDNKQAEDRVHRIGSEQHDKIMIYDLVSVGTVEERQIAMLHAKAERLEEVVRDRDLLREVLEGDG